MQRRATANPSTDGSAASHRQCAVPAISTRKPSHCGSSKNHKQKNAPPTASEASAACHRSPCSTAGTLPDSPSVIGPPVALTVSLPCDSCYLIEESDQVFPDRKRSCRERV